MHWLWMIQIQCKQQQSSGFGLLLLKYFFHQFILQIIGDGDQASARGLKKQLEKTRFWLWKIQIEYK